MWESCVRDWRRFSKEWLIELEWLAKKYSAGVVYKTKIIASYCRAQYSAIFWTTLEMKMHCVGRMNFLVSSAVA